MNRRGFISTIAGLALVGGQAQSIGLDLAPHPSRSGRLLLTQGQTAEAPYDWIIIELWDSPDDSLASRKHGIRWS
jgi:hypothetical protein